MSRKRAPGPYLYDDDEDYVPSKGVKYSETDDNKPKVKKHTLDSDEEEEDETVVEKETKDYDEMTQEGLDGQEDGTARLEDEQVITPFNMKDEMEEGHFDGDGFYHFKKDAEVKDAWLEDIDWIKIKQKEGEVNKYGSDIESDEEKEPELPDMGKEEQEALQTYQKILPLLKPGETVARALKRFGGNKKISSAQRWKMKKKGGGGGEDTSSEMSTMLQLTELANKIISGGNMDVYQETYEMINLKVQRSKAPPEIDMFGDVIEKKEGEKSSEEKKEEKGSEEKKDGEDEKSGDDSENVPKVQWHLKWENTEEAETHGPFDTSHMVAWQESGYFEKGAYVRKVADEGGSWYSTKRIDFELYE